MNPHGQQIGVLDVGWTGEAAGDPLLGDLAALGPDLPAVQWNNDVVTRARRRRRRQARRRSRPVRACGRHSARQQRSPRQARAASPR